MAEHLFSGGSLSERLVEIARSMLRVVDGLPAEQVLGANENELAEAVVAGHTVEPLKLGSPEQEPPEEVKHEIKTPTGAPAHVPATRYTLVVPFSGSPEFLRLQADKHPPNPPRAAVHDGELRITLTQRKHDMEEVRREFDRTFADIRRRIELALPQVEEYNDSLVPRAMEAIAARRDRLLKDRQTAEALPWPIKRREDAPQTYAVPTVKRKAVPELPRPASTPCALEPELPQAEYEHILSILDNMVQVMERSPSAFANMKEEDLRTHFLVQLNGQYEGQATGETFNKEGKTDILIRADGKNVFTAECKFWDGPRALAGAVDQLLSYTCWRDTKTAIIIFNRNRDLTAVLDKIPGVVQEHECYKRGDTSFKHETGCRFIMHQPGDTNRELQMTVLVYDVPSDHASGQ